MKKCIILGFLFFSLVGYTQEADIDFSNPGERKGDWLFNFQFGFGTLKADNLFKVNANIQSGFIGKEFILGKKYSLVTGLDFYDVNADFTDASNQQLFIKNRYLSIPVSIRLFTPISEKVNFYVDLGFYGSHIFRSEIDNESAGIEITDKGAGFAFGLLANFGARFEINKQNAIYAGFGSRNDLFDSFTSSQQNFELTEVVMVNLGWGYRF